MGHWGTMAPEFRLFPPKANDLMTPRCFITKRRLVDDGAFTFAEADTRATNCRVGSRDERVEDLFENSSLTWEIGYPARKSVV